MAFLFLGSYFWPYGSLLRSLLPKSYTITQLCFQTIAVVIVAHLCMLMFILELLFHSLLMKAVFALFSNMNLELMGIWSILIARHT